MPYNGDAVEWSDANFDHIYKSLWCPADIPVLRLWGEDDRIVSQRGWAAAEYNRQNVMVRAILHAGHFLWIDNPSAVSEAFSTFSARVLESLPKPAGGKEF